MIMARYCDDYGMFFKFFWYVIGMIMACYWYDYAKLLG